MEQPRTTTRSNKKAPYKGGGRRPKMPKNPVGDERTINPKGRRRKRGVAAAFIAAVLAGGAVTPATAATTDLPVGNHTCELEWTWQNTIDLYNPLADKTEVDNTLMLNAQCIKSWWKTR